MAGIFSSGTLEQVRAASDIVEVIGSYVPLKRAGANFVALCPFHREKSPSFNVNPQRQIFHCFGCHKGGDVFRFVQDYENLSFPEAVRRLAERARIVIDQNAAPGEGLRRELKEQLRTVHEQLTLRWHNLLLQDPRAEPARDYLRGRRVTEEAIRLFRLGYAPEAWDDTLNWGRSKGYDPGLLEQAGLVLKKEGPETRYYDRFRGRLMFPIADEQGRVIGFSGRILAGDEKTAKYVNSPETPLFTKGRVIFGLDKARREVLDAGSAVVCEGQLDMIACYMAGTRNVVAPQGTALTADQARILKRYADEVVLCFDSDSAGRAAAVRALGDLLESGLSVRVAQVPAPHDPDSYIRDHGGPAFAKLIAGAPGFFDFYLEHLAGSAEVTTDRGRIEVVNAMAEALAKTRNAVLLDTYAQKTALRLGVTADAVRQEFRKHGGGQAGALRSDSLSTPSRPAGLPKPASAEEWLVRIVFAGDDDATALEAIGILDATLDPGWIRDPRVRTLMERRLEAHRDGTWEGIAAFVAGLDDDETRGWVTQAASEARPVPERAQQVRDIVAKLRQQALKAELEALVRRKADPSVSPEERDAAHRREVQLRMELPRTGKQIEDIRADFRRKTEGN